MASDSQASVMFTANPRAGQVYPVLPRLNPWKPSPPRRAARRSGGVPRDEAQRPSVLDPTRVSVRPGRARVAVTVGETRERNCALLERAGGDARICSDDTAARGPDGQSSSTTETSFRVTLDPKWHVYSSRIGFCLP